MPLIPTAVGLDYLPSIELLERYAAPAVVAAPQPCDGLSVGRGRPRQNAVGLLGALLRPRSKKTAAPRMDDPMPHVFDDLAGILAARWGNHPVTLAKIGDVLVETAKTKPEGTLAFLRGLRGVSLYLMLDTLRVRTQQLSAIYATLAQQLPAEALAAWLQTWSVNLACRLDDEQVYTLRSHASLYPQGRFARPYQFNSENAVLALLCTWVAHTCPNQLPALLSDNAQDRLFAELDCDTDTDMLARRAAPQILASIIKVAVMRREPLQPVAARVWATLELGQFVAFGDALTNLQLQPVAAEILRALPYPALRLRAGARGVALRLLSFVHSQAVPFQPALMAAVTEVVPGCGPLENFFGGELEDALSAYCREPVAPSLALAVVQTAHNPRAARQLREATQREFDRGLRKPDFVAYLSQVGSLETCITTLRMDAHDVSRVCFSLFAQGVDTQAVRMRLVTPDTDAPGLKLWATHMASLSGAQADGHPDLYEVGQKILTRYGDLQDNLSYGLWLKSANPTQFGAWVGDFYAYYLGRNTPTRNERDGLPEALFAAPPNAGRGLVRTLSDEQGALLRALIPATFGKTHHALLPFGNYNPVQTLSWHDTVVDVLRGENALDSIFFKTHAFELLRHCVTGEGTPTHTLSMIGEWPAAALALLPQDFVGEALASPWETLLLAYDKPAWLVAMAESQGTFSGPRFNQINRLKALGDFLVLCAAAEVPNKRLLTMGPWMTTLLNYADVGSRRTLMVAWVEQILAPRHPDDRFATLQKHVPEDLPHGQKIFALNAWLLLGQRMAAHPAVQLLQKSSRVTGDGISLRQWIRFIQASQCGSHADRTYLHALLTWTNHTSIAALLATKLHEARQTAQSAAESVAANSADAALARQAWALARANSDIFVQARGAHIAANADQLHTQSFYGDAMLAEQTALRAALATLGDVMAPMVDTTLAGIIETLRRMDINTPQHLHNALAAGRAAVREGLKNSRGSATTGDKTHKLWFKWLGEVVDHLASLHRDCARLVDAESRAAASHSGFADTTDAYPTTLFGETSSQSVQQFYAQEIVGLLERLLDYAPFLQDAGKGPEDFASMEQLEEAVTAAFPFLRSTHDLDVLAAFKQKVSQFEYFTLYTKSFAHWGPHVAAAKSLFGDVFTAVLRDNVVALRRQNSPQLKRLMDNGMSLARRDAWEAGASALMRDFSNHVAHAEWTITDTADVSELLGASTDVSSCQSVKDIGSDNIGLLARIIDASRRMLVVKDGKDNYQGRAMLRLMRDPHGGPVLLLSRTYVRAGHDVDDALVAFAQHRARALGIPLALWPHQRSADGEIETLSCLSSVLPDYWDEIYGLSATDDIRVVAAFDSRAAAPQTDL